jgi:hypothetical protein
MLRLIQTFGAHAGRVLDFHAGVVRLGRRPDNDIAFDPHADLDASGRHAEIRLEGDAWVLVDVGSRNGTFVGPTRVERHILRDGDEIELGLGGPRLRVELTSNRAPGPSRAGPGASTSPATPLSDPSVPGAGGGPTPNGHPAPGGTPPPSTPSGTAVLPRAGDASPPGKIYGAQTVGMMIHAAVEQDRQLRSGTEAAPGAGHHWSTGAIRQVAEEAASRKNRGLRGVVVLLVLLVFAVGGALAAVFGYLRWQEAELRAENVRLQEQLAALDAEDEAERQRLEERLQQINDDLAAPQEAAGTRIAQRNRAALYLLVDRRRGGGRVVCSAFLVEEDLLATSGRCVTAIQRAVARGRSVDAMANEGAHPPLTIQQMYVHPAYDERRRGPSGDVGLLRVTGEVEQAVRLATVAEAQELESGEDLFVLGFDEEPGDLERPVASLASGVVGRLTGFDGRAVAPEARLLVSHSAYGEGSTAGSPVFDREGRVVAINAGNYRANEQVIDPGTRLGRTVQTESTYAWAVRVDLLIQLLAGLRASE